MPRAKLPPPSLTLSKQQARRFMLAHHKLWPPRQLHGKDGILEFISHVGSIQFDPINKAGRNPDLVLQSRVKDYSPELLQELLYEDRELLDGWDKLASIYQTSDWPFFERHRTRMREEHGDPSNPAMKIAPDVIETIRAQGPQSSIDLKHDERIEWSWGQGATLARAALEILYAMGEVVIHHRVGTRRVFELTDRALPKAMLSTPDPNKADEDYQNWHVQRRVQSLGIANPSATDIWLGIPGVKSAVRRATLTRLVERGDLITIAIEDVADRTFFIPRRSLPFVEPVETNQSRENHAAIIAALDNLTWDRKMLRWLFDFDYTWEIYVPAAKRKYGYYVLPVLYGDAFVGRVEPVFERKSRTLSIKNWWWEDGIQIDDDLRQALIGCIQDFKTYLRADSFQLEPNVSRDKSLGWMSQI